nr:cytochrome P450 716B1-like [Tanacetum cinerariifolium]
KTLESNSVNQTPVEVDNSDIEEEDDEVEEIGEEEEVQDIQAELLLWKKHIVRFTITFSESARLLWIREDVNGAFESEQEDIGKTKAQGEALTWEDLSKMKYTWRVASEVLRITPLVSLSFRRAKQDIEYEGFLIPKGWQVFIEKCIVDVQLCNVPVVTHSYCKKGLDGSLGPKREKFLPLFQDMIEGILAIPINLLFIQFNRGIRARKKMVPMLMDLIHEKRDILEKQKHLASPNKDLITSFLSIRDYDSSTMMSEEEIIDS